MNKLFITDLDGTLLNEKKQVSEFANQQLKTMDNVGVATGRNIFSVHKIIKNLEINSDIILCNGACVYNKDSDTFEAIVLLKRSLYFGLERLIDGIDTKPIIIGFDKERPYYQYIRNHNAQYQKFLDHAKSFESVLKTKVERYCFDADIVEIIFYDTKEVILKIKEQFENQFPDQFMYECRHSIMVDDSSLWFLAIFDKSVGKGSAIVNMAKRHQVDLKDVYVFGDGYNDVDMFKLEVNKIAVSNAVDEILELADEVIEDNTTDSVIKYILKKNR
jgi:Cof subfamily protein (haloacid dehalogenase superfamily)